MDFARVSNILHHQCLRFFFFSFFFSFFLFSRSFFLCHHFFESVNGISFLAYGHTCSSPYTIQNSDSYSSLLNSRFTYSHEKGFNGFQIRQKVDEWQMVGGWVRLETLGYGVGLRMLELLVSREKVGQHP